MPIYATGQVYVEADSIAEALELANEYDGTSVSICHQCAHEIDEPAFGYQNDVSAVSEEKTEKIAKEWIKKNS